MAEKFTFGLKSLKMGGIDPVTGLPTALADVGSVYKDTVAFTGGDVSKTEIFSQQKPNTPQKIFQTKGARSFVFSLMATDLAKLAMFGVGEVTTLDGVDELGLSDDPIVLDRSFEMETEDGTILVIYNGSVSAKENWKVADNGIWLTEITVTPQIPLKAGLKSVGIRKPEVV